MTATAEAIERRHRQGMKRLRLRKRDAEVDFRTLLSNPPTPTGLQYPNEGADFLVPEEMSGSDVLLGDLGLPSSMVGVDRKVDTRRVFEWVQEHGSVAQKHAWQWWMLERCVRTWVRGYGYVDCREDYLDWFS